MRKGSSEARWRIDIAREGHATKLSCLAAALFLTRTDWVFRGIRLGSLTECSTRLARLLNLPANFAILCHSCRMFIPISQKSASLLASPADDLRRVSDTPPCISTISLRPPHLAVTGKKAPDFFDGAVRHCRRCLPRQQIKMSHAAALKARQDPDV
jgi:hypothetical protein